jgi:hypothetical protein
VPEFRSRCEQCFRRYKKNELSCVHSFFRSIGGVTCRQIRAGGGAMRNVETQLTPSDFPKRRMTSRSLGADKNLSVQM